MKRFVAALFVTVLASFAHAVAGADAHPLHGTWRVDTSRLPMAESARPKSVTLIFSDAGPRQLRMQVRVVDPADQVREADAVLGLDGAASKVESNFEADTVAALMPNPAVLVLQMSREGVPGSTRTYSVGADRNAMIETVAYFTAEGLPALRHNYFKRQSDTP